MARRGVNATELAGVGLAGLTIVSAAVTGVLAGMFRRRKPYLDSDDTTYVQLAVELGYFHMGNATYNVDYDHQGQPMPVTVCQKCHLPIEFYNHAWWVRGTCMSQCAMGRRNADGLHLDWHVPTPVQTVPPLHDREALERWLNED